MIYKFIVLFIFFCHVHCQTVSKHFPNKDEYQVIDKSRKIIKRIEDCNVDTREYSGNPGDDSEVPIINSPEDVICGETSFMHITRLNENKIQDLEVMRKAMSVTYKAIQQMNAYIDIAAFIENAIPKPKKGQWLSIVGKTANYDTSLKERIPEYLDFTISHIKVQIFNIESDCGNSRGNPVQPETTIPSSYSPKINPNTPGVLKRNSMTNDQRKDTMRFIKNAFKEYSNTEDGLNFVCPYVTNELTSNYGSNKWACVIGEKNYYQFTTSLNRGSQLQAQYDNLLVEIIEIPAETNCVQPNLVTQSPKLNFATQYDIINGARAVLDINYVEVNDTRLDFQNRNRVIQVVLDTVATQPTFEGISKNLQVRLNQIYGQYWTAVVGTNLQFWTYFYTHNPYFINLKIDQLRVLAYKQISYRA